MSALRALCCALGATLIAACAGIEPASLSSTAIAPAVDGTFAIDGRLSARRGTDAVAVGFSWRHDPPRDELVVTSPLGQSLAELRGDAAKGQVQLTLADGRSDTANDWSVLTERALGFPLPVDSLAAWVRGAPHAASPHAVEADRSGRAIVLRQDGWEIVYTYDGVDARQPMRLRLAGAELEVRIVIDRWF